MQPFTTLTGVVAPIDRVSVDTDQLMPKQFLKRVEKTGYGQFLFFDWRFQNDGTPNPDFELNRPGYAGASILVAGRNFGCGSSREHAPWGLLDYGFRALIAPSYADIFFNNCFKNGILPIVLPEQDVRTLLDAAIAKPGYQLTIDLAQQTIDDGAGFSRHFDVDQFRRHCLLNGLDDVGLTLQHDEEIAAFESNRPAWRPTTTTPVSVT